MCGMHAHMAGNGNTEDSLLLSFSFSVCFSRAKSAPTLEPAYTYTHMLPILLYLRPML